MTRNYLQRLKGSGEAPAERDPKLATLLGRFARAAERAAGREDAEAEEREARKPRALPFRSRFGRRKIN